MNWFISSVKDASSLNGIAMEAVFAGANFYSKRRKNPLAYPSPHEIVVLSILSTTTRI